MQARKGDILLTRTQASTALIFPDACMNRKNTSKHHKEMKEVKMNSDYQVTHVNTVLFPMEVKRYSREENKEFKLKHTYLYNLATNP